MIQFYVEPTIFKPRLKFKPPLKFFKFGHRLQKYRDSKILACGKDSISFDSLYCPLSLGIGILFVFQSKRFLFIIYSYLTALVPPSNIVPLVPLSGQLEAPWLIAPPLSVVKTIIVSLYKLFFLRLATISVTASSMSSTMAL